MLSQFLLLRRARAHRKAADVTDAVARRSALVLAPHPDDETLGCGATIMRKLAAGSRVTVVIATDGRHSHATGHLTPDALAALRRGEASEAMSRLGLRAEDLRLLGFEDQSLLHDEPALTDAIRGLIAELRPDEVYATGVFEPPPDHAALGRAARAAIRREPGPVLMEYPIWLWNQVWHGQPVPLRRRIATVSATVRAVLGGREVVRVRCGTFTDRKMHALDAHASQLRRPDGVPPQEPWFALPSELVAGGREGEIFLPWRP